MGHVTYRTLSGFDLLWATYLPNLKSLTPAITDIKSDAKCRKRGGLGSLEVICSVWLTRHNIWLICLPNKLHVGINMPKRIGSWHTVCSACNSVTPTCRRAQRINTSQTLSSTVTLHNNATCPQVSIHHL